MVTLEQTVEEGIAAHERFVADMRALDYAWLQSVRDGNRAPFDAFLDRYIAQEVNRGRSDGPDSGGN